MPNEPVDVFQHISMQGPTECWPWAGAWGGQSRDQRPYFMARRKRKLAYRWVWELVNGSEPQGMILHSCDNGGYPVGCCNPNHMRVGTHEQNTKDMTDRQRHGLPATVVRAIRRMLADGKKTHEEIAEQWGLTRETVSAINQQRAYKHLKDEANP